MLKILRIDCGTPGGPKATEVPAGEYAGLGGRHLTSALVAKEVPPLCHPLSAENKLILAPGMLGGTVAAMSGRLSVGAKSPLTGGIKEANAGGQAAQVLARLGYAAIVLEGKPQNDDDLYTIRISKSGVEITKDNSLKMLPNYDLAEKMKSAYGDRVALICIGPAGEMKLSGASVACTDINFRPTRHAGRGGLGAVMGAKGIKVIVLDDSGMKMRSAEDPWKFKAANKRFIRGLKEHAVTGKCLPAFGTNVMTNVINEIGAYPAFNFKCGTFEGAYRISGETVVETEKARKGAAGHGCQRGCVIRCSGIYNDKSGNYLTKQPEYETVWAHGANCGISDLDAIAMLDFLDDNYGLDSIEIGASLAIAMEAGVSKFGDAQGAVRLVKEVGRGTPLGRILGSGAATTGRIFGVERVPVIKGQALPGYDPRAIQGLGLIYATNPMGGDHSAGCAASTDFLSLAVAEGPVKQKGLIELSRDLQIFAAAFDATGICLFVSYAVQDQPETFQSLLDMMNAFHGLNFNCDDFMAMGKAILKTERDFNTRAGFTKEHDRVPRFFQTEQLAPHNVLWTVPDEDLDKISNW